MPVARSRPYRSPSEEKTPALPYAPVRRIVFSPPHTLCPVQSHVRLDAAHSDAAGRRLCARGANRAGTDQLRRPVPPAGRLPPCGHRAFQVDLPRGGRYVDGPLPGRAPAQLPKHPLYRGDGHGGIRASHRRRPAIFVDPISGRANGYVSPVNFRSHLFTAHPTFSFGAKFDSWAQTVAPHELTCAMHFEIDSGIGLGGPVLRRPLAGAPHL